MSAGARPVEHAASLGSREHLSVVVSIELGPEHLEAVAQRVAAILAEGAAPAQAAPSWVDAKSAAAHLSTSTGRIYDLVQLGKLTPRRDGRRLLFRREELDAYLEAVA